MLERLPFDSFVHVPGPPASAGPARVAPATASAAAAAMASASRRRMVALRCLDDAGDVRRLQDASASDVRPGSHPQVARASPSTAALTPLDADLRWCSTVTTTLRDAAVEKVNVASGLR